MSTIGKKAEVHEACPYYLYGFDLMAHCCVEFYPPSIQGNHKWRNHQSVVVTHYSILVVWITRDKKKTVNDYK